MDVISDFHVVNAVFCKGIDLVVVKSLEIMFVAAVWGKYVGVDSCEYFAWVFIFFGSEWGISFWT